MFAEDQLFESPVLTIWRFVREDTPAAQFEAWLYSSPDVEARLGSDLYFECISADYTDADQVFALRSKLGVAAVSMAGTPACACVTHPNCAVVDMGWHGATFATLTELARRSDPWWWLSLYRCHHCGESWLVAAEERQNDVYILRRLHQDVAAAIVEAGAWPHYLETYEELLAIGRDAGCSARFLDPSESSLSATIADLARERPGITIQEVASLLNLDEVLAVTLAEKLAPQIRAQIDFGQDPRSG